MKKIFYLLIITIVFASCKNDQAKTNADSSMKEVNAEIAGMKTCIIQYKAEMTAEGMKSTSLVTHYIDFKNDKSAMETETSGEMMGVKIDEKTLTIDDDKFNYFINLKEKEGVKTSVSEMEDDPMDMIKSEDDVTFREKIEKEGGKVVGNETFLGKNCIVVEMNQEGQTMKMWYYKGIPLKITSQLYTMEATKFEENVSIPASKFVVPDGIKFTEIPSMPQMN